LSARVDVCMAVVYSLSFCRPRAHPVLHSFPTRRSSDLIGIAVFFLFFESVVSVFDLSNNFEITNNLAFQSGSYPKKMVQRFLSRDRKSTRLNSSHVKSSYAVFCLKKKRHNTHARLPMSA